MDQIAQKKPRKIPREILHVYRNFWIFKFLRKVNSIESIFNQFGYSIVIETDFEMFWDPREKIYVVFASLLANYDWNDRLDVGTRQK